MRVRRLPCVAVIVRPTSGAKVDRRSGRRRVAASAWTGSATVPATEAAATASVEVRNARRESVMGASLSVLRPAAAGLESPAGMRGGADRTRMSPSGHDESAPLPRDLTPFLRAKAGSQPLLQ